MIVNRRTLSTEEFARDVEGFGSHDDDLLAVEELFRNSAGKSSAEMSLAVNDDLKCGFDPSAPCCSVAAQAGFASFAKRD